MAGPFVPNLAAPWNHLESNQLKNADGWVPPPEILMSFSGVLPGHRSFSAPHVFLMYSQVENHWASTW